MKTISASYLMFECLACLSQVDLFISTFGRETEVEVTIENALTAINAGLDLDWLAGEAFTAAAWEVYDHATAPEWPESEQASIVAAAFVAGWEARP